MSVERSHFGTLSDGRSVDRFTLRNRRASAEILTFGAIVKAFRPAGSGRSVILGYDTLAEYLHDGAHHGDNEKDLGPKVHDRARSRGRQRVRRSTVCGRGKEGNTKDSSRAPRAGGAQIRV